ncbi:hypothetical protein PYCCODRAFT_1445926 [Trametes coccinea BRFM310]|uniref:Ferritin-like domain-containing protein n=1 Tax=Trametes coccinea (strain BRFM310) TaxID=1353009 RepID=A0A1Y2IIH1_TRAC3|nr:hypothetical protein PYCCODRAFT_1445926 [Trametes coccinea BRFM310]
MQLALTLEHLESAFYSGGLSKYSASAFEKAGYPSWVHDRFQQIADNEAAHVAYLTDALGSDAPAPCTYDFQYNDVKSFIDMAQKIESISAGAYLGAARHINDTSILNIGVAIGGTESRQASWITSSVLKKQPWDGAFETDIPPSPAYSLLQQYIVNCPDSNPDLPVANLPTLKVSDPTPKAGQTITLTFQPGSSASPLYAAWANGLNYTYTEVNNNKTTVPHGLTGTVFVGLVTNMTRPDRDTFATGWAAVDFPFDSSARPEKQ